MTGAALKALAQSDVIIGYETYLDLVSDLLTGKEVISSAMTREVDRSYAAVDAALGGKKVAVVSSGDAGIYGMAGIILEVVYDRGAADLEVEVVPGVTAASAAAAVLGAPLMHDFAVISLSDLLTPWELILQRVEYAAKGDFILVLYNPRSKRRVKQIEEVQQLLLSLKPGDTPVGIVQNALRGESSVYLTDIAHFLEYPIDMFSLVIVGNSETFIRGQHMITPRGYRL